jgi:hypothetical protein
MTLSTDSTSLKTINYFSIVKVGLLNLHVPLSPASEDIICYSRPPGMWTTLITKIAEAGLIQNAYQRNAKPLEY